MLRTACLTICLLGAAPLAAAQQPTLTHTIQQETTLVLRGEGEVRLPPDYATIDIGVQIESRTAADAMNKQRTRMTSVLAALKQAGLQEKDIRTSSLSLNQVYDYPDNDRPRLRGYTAGNIVSVKVRDLGKLGGVLDTVVAAGSNSIDRIAFGVEDEKTPRREARQSAVKDATAKAEDYAAAMGYRVKRIVNLSEPNLGQPGFDRIIVTASKVGGGSTPIQPGELTLSQAVDVTFELTK